MQNHGPEMAATLESLTGGSKKTASDLLTKQSGKVTGNGSTGTLHVSIPEPLVGELGDMKDSKM